MGLRIDDVEVGAVDQQERVPVFSRLSTWHRSGRSPEIAEAALHGRTRGIHGDLVKRARICRGALRCMS